MRTPRQKARSFDMATSPIVMMRGPGVRDIVEEERSVEQPGSTGRADTSSRPTPALGMAPRCLYRALPRSGDASLRASQVLRWVSSEAGCQRVGRASVTGGMAAACRRRRETATRELVMPTDMPVLRLDRDRREEEDMTTITSAINGGQVVPTPGQTAVSKGVFISSDSLTFAGAAAISSALLGGLNAFVSDAASNAYWVLGTCAVVGVLIMGIGWPGRTGLRETAIYVVTGLLNIFLLFTSVMGIAAAATQEVPDVPGAVSSKGE